jgi:peptide/nickel transport system permease protein
VLSRTIYGARTSIGIGFSVIAFSTVMSAAVGITSGYFRSWYDSILQRFVDMWLVFPALMLIILVISVTGHSVFAVIVALSMVTFAGQSRVVRSMTLSVVAQPYVEAARALGAGHSRLIMRHVLPNVAPVIIVNASVLMGAVILAESSLSFLGYGPPPPTPSWGSMLDAAQRWIRVSPYLAIFPGVCIALTVYAFNMFGDALRDVLDPRLRGSR